MRIVHTADWHLGKRLCEVSLLEDQAYALDQVLALCRDERADALLLAGDIYDRAVPPVEAVELFSAFLRRATERGTKVVAISGNHDSPERLGFGAELLGHAGVHFLTRLAGRAEPVVLERGRRRLHVYGVPFLGVDEARAELGADIDGQDHAVRAALAALHADRRERGANEAVLLAHLFAAGGIESVDSERPLIVGGATRVEADTLRGWTYVALGHLHRPQAVFEREDVRYSGSLLKYSVAEAEHEKGVTLVDVLFGRAAATPVRLTPRRDLVRIEGSFDELMHDARFVPAERAYVEVTYTDAGYVVEAAQRLRQRYPHLLAAVPRQLRRVLEEASVPAPPARPDDLLRDFWQYVEGEPLPEDGEYARAFDEALAEARSAPEGLAAAAL